jgi:murein DD-endopeptidase MepM/ murein hydrolase activator NlpD
MKASLKTKRAPWFLFLLLPALFSGFAVSPAGAVAPVTVLGVNPGSSNGGVIVGPGDTIGGIARRYDVTARDLAGLNGLDVSQALKPGQRLLLPNPPRHVVGAQDTLYSLSRMYGVSPESLAKANDLKPPYTLYPGDELRVPRQGADAPEPHAEPPRKAAEAKHHTAHGRAHTRAADYHRHTKYAWRDEKVRMLKTPGPSKTHQAFTAMLGKIAGSHPRSAHPVEPLGLNLRPASQPGFVEGPRVASAAPETVEAEALPVMAYKGASSGAGRHGFIWPVRGQVISGFGPKDGGLYNDGINIAAPRGTPVGASADGVVAYVGDKLKSYGNLVLIRHHGGVVTAYAHLNTVTVRPGMRVERGQTIGSVGSTGTVLHAQLHFEVRRGTEKINPQHYLG